MDNKARGKLQALLSGLELQNGKETVCVEGMNSDIHTFVQNVNKYMNSAATMAKEFQVANTNIQRLESQLSTKQSELDSECNQIHKLQKQCKHLKNVEGQLEDFKLQLRQVEKQAESYKADIEGQERSIKQRDSTIQSINVRLADRDANIEALTSTVRQNVERLAEFCEDVKKEKDRSESLVKDMEKLESSHVDEMNALRIEMGEKVLRAQVKITQHAAGTSYAAGCSSALNYRDIFKKKLSHLESRHQKEVADLQKTVCRLQQQLRDKS